MKTIHTQITALLTGTALISSLASAAPNGSETTAAELEAASANALPQEAEGGNYTFDGLKKSLQEGRFWMNFRYRFENVDQQGISKDARASTLRTRLGYESATYNHWSGLIEFSDVSTVPGGYEDYNDTINGKTDYPVVADPSGTVVNQVYAKYDGLWDGTVKLGRQRIDLDNSRFIGNVIWRQTEQTYDAASFHKSDLAGLDVIYAYVDHINRIQGPHSPAGNLDSNSHVLNASKTFEDVGKLTGYGYYIDAPDATSINSFTYGLRFNGDHAFDRWTMLYTAELAHQNDVADNPNDVNAGYMHAVLGGRVDALTVKGGYEILEGGDTALNAFQTPLATLHAHNGWADKFLVTPAGGLEDLYLSGGYKMGNTDFLAVYHDFSSETGSVGGYGSELDLQVVHHFDCGIEAAVKYANFSSDQAFNGGDQLTADTQKLWFWLYYSF